MGEENPLPGSGAAPQEIFFYYFGRYLVSADVCNTSVQQHRVRRTPSDVQPVTSYSFCGARSCRFIQARIREESSLFSATSEECESRFCGGGFRRQRRRRRADLAVQEDQRRRQACCSSDLQATSRGVQAGGSGDNSSSDQARRRQRQQACCGGGGASGSTQAEAALSSGGRQLQEAAVAGGFRWRRLYPVAADSSRWRQQVQERQIHRGRRTGAVARRHRYRPAISELALAVSFKQELERNPAYFRPPVRSVRAGSVEAVSGGSGGGGERTSQCRRIRGGDRRVAAAISRRHREVFRRRQRRQLQFRPGAAAAAAAGVLRRRRRIGLNSGGGGFVQRRQAAPGGGSSRRIQVEAALSSGRQLQAATTGAGTTDPSGKKNMSCRPATSIPPGDIGSSSFWSFGFPLLFDRICLVSGCICVTSSESQLRTTAKDKLRIHGSAPGHLCPAISGKSPAILLSSSLSSPSLFFAPYTLKFAFSKLLPDYPWPLSPFSCQSSCSERQRRSDSTGAQRKLKRHL
ncbi:hypothetical protein KSP40_PGU001795 [Platanthera guangdongensis]|uniref:Uncharacterized protein n=1 Tax=Platanthera guangdongensis TaxID=2320717 RepID=A0ABR2MNM3_9ASPA